MGTHQLLSQTIFFVLPYDRNLPSGGNIYNEQLIDALRHLGQAVEIIDFRTYREVILQDREGLYGVDSLFVEEMKPLLAYIPKRACSFFIMHHLQSLHPPAGMDADCFFNKHEREVLHFFQAFLLSSAYSKTYLQQKGIMAPMMVVEPAASLFSPSPSPSPSLPLEPPVKGLMVANVVERKGILPFLEALARQTDAKDNFILNIIGRTDMEADYFRACLQCLESTGLRGKVHFRGALKHSDTLKQYGQHHVFLSAAYMETFGMAIQEAKVQGLPLLLCGGGNAESHLRSGGGMLCADISELAGNFIELCRNDTLMQEIWQSAKAEENTCEGYTWNQAATHFLKLCRNFYT